MSVFWTCMFKFRRFFSDLKVKRRVWNARMKMADFTGKLFTWVFCYFGIYSSLFYRNTYNYVIWAYFRTLSCGFAKHRRIQANLKFEQSISGKSTTLMKNKRTKQILYCSSGKVTLRYLNSCCRQGQSGKLARQRPVDMGEFDTWPIVAKERMSDRMLCKLLVFQPA